jgi:glycosyltransferase involved in cell wall biosynthesis
MTFSVVIPVYRNEASLPDLLAALAGLHRSLEGELEVVFVVDGSPDRSLEILTEALRAQPFRSQLVALSRNFGAFEAIRAGLAACRGDLFGVMAADLQEPPELMLEFKRVLETGSCDVVVGTRAGREDPLPSRLLSRLFWGLYRRLVQREFPAGGVDVFGGTRQLREQLLALRERNSTLVGLLFWLGFRRREVPYHRQRRRHGRGAWTLARRVRYLLDSTFAFSDLPVRLLSAVGTAGIVLAFALAAVVLAFRVTGRIAVPGYAATAVLIIFFGGLNSLGLGIIGEYVARAFENTKGRPLFVVARHDVFEGSTDSR